jgi:hypothetical protein
MPLRTAQDVRQRIDAELLAIRDAAAAGDARAARDRVQVLSLIASVTDPRAVDIGHVCLAAGFREMAGRYWYLQGERTPEMTDAVAAFEHACGDNPAVILDALGHNGEWDLSDHPALARLKEREKSLREEHDLEYVGGLFERLLPVGCIAGLIACFAVFIIGIVQVIDWLTGK